MKRQIIDINEEKCNGCGQCIPNCHEGALQIVDGKARLISDLFCDGLGACIGHCPEGAITLFEREAEPYNERKVMEIIVSKGRNTILAHLDHLREHNETTYLKEAIDFIKVNNIDMSPPAIAPVKEDAGTVFAAACGCHGSAPRDFRDDVNPDTLAQVDKSSDLPVPSELRHWPVQLHLLNPRATYLQSADLLLAADCAAFTVGDFHRRFMKDKALAIACPKLDHGKDIYVDKLSVMISESKINTVTVVMMEVPCCGGLMQLVELAMQKAGMKIPVKQVTIGIKGNILAEQWA